MTQKLKIKWLKDIEEHDYPAAESYLSLIYDKWKTFDILHGLRLVTIESYKAKDIFRASQLSLLGISNSHVKKDIKKIKRGIALSPIILSRDPHNGRVTIADGYHRLCAVYSLDEDALIPCKLV